MRRSRVCWLSEDCRVCSIAAVENWDVDVEFQNAERELLLSRNAVPNCNAGIATG